MGTLREKARPVIVIAVTAVLFAAYHMSLLRFFTVGLIGLSFTVAAFKSRSIFVSMLMHFCNNLLACLMQWYPDTVGKVFETDISESAQTGIVILILLGAIIAVILGYLLLDRVNKRAAD